jgi:hypothetical protein
VDVVPEAVWHLVVDLRAEPGQAAKGGLDVPARAAEAIIEVDMAKRRIEVIDPDQLHHPPPEPDAFGIAGWAVDGLRRFNELVGLALIFLGRIGCIVGGRFALVLVAALGKRAACGKQQDQSGDGEMAQNRDLSLKHATHEFPDCICFNRRPAMNGSVMPKK